MVPKNRPRGKREKSSQKPGNSADWISRVSPLKCQHSILHRTALSEVAAIMPEEMEIPIEQVHEHIHHEAHHSEAQWVSMVALSTAILAALAAIASLLSGLHANKAIDNHIYSNDRWSYYQEKNVKATLLETRVQMLEAFDKKVSPDDVKHIKKEHDDMAGIQKDAEKKEADSSILFQRHENLAPSVTLFQIAVAISAIAVLTKRQWFWHLSLLFGVVAFVFLIYGEFYPFKPESNTEEKPAAKANPEAHAMFDPAGRTLPASFEFNHFVS